MKKKPIKVCFVSYSSLDEHYSYGYGAVRVIAHALQSCADAQFAFHDLKAGCGNAGEDADLISAQEPDVAGFSVYMWNIERVEQTLALVRDRLPQAIVILGGPGAAGFERVSRGPWLPDCIVLGEGETAFSSLLSRLAMNDDIRNGAQDFRAEDKCKGMFQPQLLEEPVKDLDDLASPYLNGIFTPPGELFYIETSRGCPHSCAFCVCGSRRSGLRFFNMRTIRDELVWAAERGKRKINLCDAALNYNTRRLKEFVRITRDADPGRILSYTFALHADSLTREQIRILSGLDIACATMGLNSTNPATYGPAGRAIDPEKFREKARLLNELPNANITILMGLPGDTVDGFKATLDYCADLGIQTNCYELRVFPGTEFFDRTAEYDLKTDPADNMRASSCNTYSEDDFEVMRQLLLDYIKTGAPFVRGDG
jgi:radical SAM superfamily enzyme YgiQ (UPF0313 family)